jgi:tetratricopeptide (TPR) repeat protein
MVRELGLSEGQYRTRADDGIGELQLQEIARAVEDCRFTVLIASSAARWDRIAQFAAGLAQHAGLTHDPAHGRDAPRLIVIARDCAFGADAERAALPLEHRALVGLDCSDEPHTVQSLARLRELLALEPPIDHPPACPYPGLERFTAVNRDLLFGRDADRAALVQRIRAGHSRILVVGPSGSGKSSLIHAAVLPELSPGDHVVQVVPRGGELAVALRAMLDALELPQLGDAIDRYLRAVAGASDADIETARAALRATPVPDPRRRVVVIDPLEEVFADDDAAARDALFDLLGGLWSLPWCTVVLCMRADFYGAIMAVRCWRELETCQYPVAALDQAGLVAAIVEPARRAGVHVDAALVERLIREIDRDRSSVPLPLLQVALKQLWGHLRWRYLTLADYERIVDRDQRGLGAVLAVHAEAVVQALTGPGDRAVAQRILLDLIHLGEGRPHTRRRRTIDELRRSGDAPGQLDRVLEALIQGRLVTTGDGDPSTARRVDRQLASPSATTGATRRGAGSDPTAEPAERHVDLAHDTLITSWPALAGWIAERRDDLRTQRRFEARAAAGGLLAPAELAELDRWIATPAGTALGASAGVRTLIRKSAAARRLRRAMLGGGAAAVTATAIVFAVQTRQLRDEQTRTRRSISKATEAAKLIVFEVDDKLKTVACAGAAKVRDTLLKSSRDLLAELRTLGELDDAEQRIASFGKTAQADFALERGRLAQAYALYQEALGDAQRRAAADPHNATWQGDLAAAYHKLGEVAVTSGKLDDARAWFDKALAIRKALTATDASNADWQRDLAASYQKLGEVAVDTGKLNDAQTWLEHGLAVRQALTASDASPRSWQRELLVSYGGLRDVAIAAGKVDAARTWSDKELALAEALTASDPSNATWQRDLAIAYVKQGDQMGTAGELHNARGWFEKALAVLKPLAAADPTNLSWRRDLAVGYEMLGDVAVTAGKIDDARSWFDSALAIRVTLDAAAPNNTDWKRDFWVACNKLGDVAMAAGSLDAAQARFEQGHAIADILVATDPSNVRWQRDLSISCENLGEIAVATGRIDDARAWFSRSLAIRRTLAVADPSNADGQSDLARTYHSLGEVAVAAGKIDRARDWFEQSLAIRKPLAAAVPSNTEWQRDLSASYQGLAEVDAASGKLAAARDWLDKAFAIRKALTAASPSNTESQRDLCITLARMAAVSPTADEAARDRREARAIYRKLQRAGLFRGDRAFTELGAELDPVAARIGKVSAVR